MINGTWLVLLLGSYTSLQCLLRCSLSVVPLSVAIWTHNINHDRTNNSGVPFFGQIIKKCIFIVTMSRHFQAWLWLQKASFWRYNVLLDSYLDYFGWNKFWSLPSSSWKAQLILILKLASIFCTASILHGCVKEENHSSCWMHPQGSLCPLLGQVSHRGLVVAACVERGGAGGWQGLGWSHSQPDWSCWQWWLPPAEIQNGNSPVIRGGEGVASASPPSCRGFLVLLCFHLVLDSCGC